MTAPTTASQIVKAPRPHERNARYRKSRIPVNQLREYRLRHNLSQREVATYTGLNDAQISNYENGYSTPDIWSALILARFFECHVDDLFQLPEVEV